MLKSHPTPRHPLVASSPVRGIAMAAILTAGVFAGTPAAAEPSSDQSDRNGEVARLNEEGASFYEARQFRQAIERFIQAYAIDHDPNLLFNIARCYEKLGDNGGAIEKYQEYLKSPGADAQGRSRAQASLRALEDLERHQREAADAPKPATATDADASEADAKGEAQGQPSAALAASPFGEEETGPSIWPWATLGAGVVFAGAGGVSYALGESNHGTVEGDPAFSDPTLVHSLTEQQARQLVADGDTKKALGVTGLALGGAFLVTSAVWFWISGDNFEAGSGTSVALSGSDGPGVTVRGRF